MKTTHSLAFALLPLCTACASQSPSTATVTDQAAIQQACKDPNVQCGDQPVPIALHFSDGHAFKQILQPPIPLVQYDHVYLYPGQTLYIEADVDGDKLVHLHAVPTPEHPEKTLVLSFDQSGSNGGEGMMFTIHQPFGRPLKYHAQVMDFDSSPRSLKPASSCPVASQSGGYETWPEPLVEVAVGDFHFLDQSSPDAATCTY